MSTAVPNPPVLNEPLQHFVLPAVSYEQFVAITDAWGERSGLRVSFDGSRLEIMTTSRLHERWKRILSRLIDMLTLHLDIPMEGGGQMTFRSQLVERGLEPDDCFWIQNFESILGVDDWVAEVHQPPDLAVEIVVTRGVINRKEIYSKLGVQELWVFDSGNLVALQLQADGAYQETERSVAFPFLDVSLLVPFLTMDWAGGETKILKQFIAWLKNQNFPGDSHS